MHLAWELEELRRLASGTMDIRSLAADAPAPRLADGTLVVSFKRRTGAPLACFNSPACLPAPGTYTHLHVVYRPREGGDRAVQSAA